MATQEVFLRIFVQDATGKALVPTPADKVKVDGVELSYSADDGFAFQLGRAKIELAIEYSGRASLRQWFDSDATTDKPKLTPYWPGKNNDPEAAGVTRGGYLLACMKASPSAKATAVNARVNFDYTVTLHPAREGVMVIGTDYWEGAAGAHPHQAHLAFDQYTLTFAKHLYASATLNESSPLTVLDCQKGKVTVWYREQKNGWQPAFVITTKTAAPKWPTAASFVTWYNDIISGKTAASQYLGASDIYQCLSRLGTERPGTVANLSIFSHGWAGGPIVRGQLMRPIRFSLPLAVLLCAVAGCFLRCKGSAVSRGTPAASPASRDHAPAPLASSPPEEEDPCAVLRREAAPRQEPDEAREQWVCLSMQGSAWAAFLEPQPPESGYTVLRTLYASPAKAGTPRAIHRGEERLAMPLLEPEAPARLSSGASYDFDHDGRPEFFIKVTLIDKQHGDVIYGRLNTFDGARIRDYAPARGLPMDELVDADHDGRPDLLLAYALPGEPVVKRCALPRNNNGYLRHLAHALPDGKFSLDDSAAIAFAKSECPGPPPPSLPSAREPEPLLQAIRCRRLWGDPPEALQAQAMRACGRLSTKDPCSGLCGSLQDPISHYARFTPPLTLHP